MPRFLALVLCVLFLGLLVYRDVKKHPGLSHALWVPIIWFFIAGSRSFSAWIHLGVANVLTAQAYSEGNALDRNFQLVLILLAVVIVLRRKASWVEFFKNNRAVLLFVAYCALSLVWSDAPFIAFKRFIRFAGLFPVLMILLSEHRPAEAAYAVIRRCSYFAIPLSYLFVRYYPEFGRYYIPWSGQVQYSGICSNKNELGIICLVAVLYFLWDLLAHRKQEKRFLKSIDTWTTIIVLLIAIYLVRIAQSATALACIVVGALIIIATELPGLKRNPRTLGAKVAGMTVALIVLQLSFNFYDVIIRVLGRDASLTGRTFLWNMVLGMATNPLLGAGYESFWTATRLSYVWTSGAHALQAHNGFIDTYLNLGFLGVALFIGLLAICFIKISRDFPFYFEFNRLKLAFLVAFILMNYTEAAFPRPGYMMAIFFLCLAVFDRQSRRIPSSGIPEASPPGQPAG